MCQLSQQNFLSGFPGIYRIFQMFLNTLIRLDTDKIIEVNCKLAIVVCLHISQTTIACSKEYAK